MNMNTPVSEIMTKNIVTISPNQKLVDVKHFFEKTPFHHHLPVVKENKLVGMLSLVDFMRTISYATLDDNELVYQTRVEEVMTPNPVTVASSAIFFDIAQTLSKGDVHALVIADKGEVKGIISYSDIIRLFLKMEDAV
jgi:acetoin utilization protein AcuB